MPDSDTTTDQTQVRDMIARHTAEPGRGGRFVCRPFLLLAILLASPMLLADANVDEVEALTRVGTPQLALRVIDDIQPAATEDTVGWMEWESRRLTLLRDDRQWDTLLDRLTRHPLRLPAAFADWARTLQAEALVEQGAGSDARALLRSLIWRTTPPTDPNALAYWRRLVIRSYLAERRHDDAYLALLRHRQDYGDGDHTFRQLQARVLLQADRPGDALRSIASDRSTTGEALRLLSTLRSDAAPATEVLARAQALAIAEPAERFNATERFHFWSVATAAAEALEETASRVGALESGLQLAANGRDPLLRLEPAALWQAYLDHGHTLGNRARLLVGDDAAWAALAATRVDTSALDARALYAALALDGRDAALRQQGHLHLAGLLAQMPNGMRLLRRLYVDSGRFADFGELPEGIRYTLADESLAAGDYGLASRLLFGLESPPPNSDTFDWQLRRARILILGGEREGGAMVLRRLITAQPERSVVELSRLLQVMFDLQTVGEHDHAITLFDDLLALDIDDRHRREILYWSADSHRLRDRHVEAARLYLRSATLLDPYSMDDWAQTARYQASRELAAAKLAGDARALLRGLLNATRDASRRATLERDLQQLWLLDGEAPR